MFFLVKIPPNISQTNIKVILFCGHFLNLFLRYTYPSVASVPATLRKTCLLKKKKKLNYFKGNPIFKHYGCSKDVCIYIKLNHRLRIGSWWFNFLPCQHLIENAGNEYEGLHCNPIYISSMAVQRMCALHIKLYKHYIKWYNFLPCQHLIENAGNEFFHCWTISGSSFVQML